MADDREELLEEISRPRSPIVLVAQFFLIPLMIVLVGVGIFILFGLITNESKGPRDYLYEMKANRGRIGAGETRRWQAAYELSNLLALEAEKISDPKRNQEYRNLAPEMIALFEEARQDGEVRLRQYLALALGRLGDQRAVPHLIEALKDQDTETRLYAAWALGVLKANEAVPELIKFLESDDPALRKMGAHVLGALGDARALPGLREALEDSVDDVRWNAALALARFGDRGGVAVLMRMLDRNYLNSIPSMREDQKEQVMVSAIEALAALGERQAEPLFRAISQSDPSLKVRQAALRALK